LNDKIFKISLKDRRYPSLLRKIPDAPKEIFARGNLDFGNKNFAIVGTRSYTAYGKQVCQEFASKIAQAGFCIVSGLARGIDSFAHQTALEKNQKTVAVLGNGLDDESIFPASNLYLAKKIIAQGGCLISEYAPGVKGAKYTFPQRNRLIAGLSLGVLVIEAQEKSGSLITANFAKKYHKKLFAVPNSIYSQTSQGCLDLITNHQAICSYKPEIVLAHLGLKQADIFSMNIKGQTPQEQMILDAISLRAMHIDEIIKSTGQKPEQIVAQLANLEILSKVKNLGNGFFCLNI